MVINRFDVFWVNLNPTIGSEINKLRPCVIVSPNELNRTLDTVIIAPLTSTIRQYPSRVSVAIKGKSGQVCLDQLQSVDKTRLTNKMGELTEIAQRDICEVLVKIFVF